MPGGLYVRFADGGSTATAQLVHELAGRMLASLPEGVTDVVPAYGSIFVEYDARRLRRASVEAWVRSAATGARTGAATAAPAGSAPRTVEIPTVYDGADLPEVAARLGLAPDEVARRHAAATYTAFAVGFTPGFPFLGPLDASLRLPRRPAPRPRVPAHAVAVAGDQTGIYPVASPGGWHLLGRALVAVYDPTRDAPFLIEPGDRVRFVATPGGATPPEPPHLDLLPAEPRHPVLSVEEPGLADLVVDAGRLRVGRFGLARSGAADPWTAAQADRLAGNRPPTVLLELNVRGPVLRALAPVTVGVAGWGLAPRAGDGDLPAFARHTLAPGETLSFRPLRHGLRAYLALPGGIESARFRGSASVDLRGGVGRPLRRGDVLGSVRPPSDPPALGAGVATGDPMTDGREAVVLRLRRGPQGDDRTLEALTGGVFEVRGADRMGVRLGGPRVPGGELRSEATPLGAVQVTADGDPILLLVDRGTLGGYVKPAVVDDRDLARAAQLRPGRWVAFRVVDDAPYPELVLEP